MGCRHDVLQSEQRRVRTRLRRVDVETGSGDPAFGHRGEQCVFIHDSAARSIDDVNGRLYLAQRFFPNEADGLRRLGQVHRDEVSIGQQLVEGDHVHTQLGRSRWLNVRVVRDQIHPERGKALRNEDPDPTKPTMPTVLSATSTPVYLERFHSPRCRAEFAGTMLRALASNSPTANSAALTMLEVGAFTTMTPAWVAALTSTLSSPTPARAMTFRRFAAAMASASTFVAERTKMASTSAIAGINSSRLAPSQRTTSKSGPRASTVAGDSSSAINTRDADTGEA